MNALSLALQSGAILLREGVEAILVLAALGAFLKRAGASGAVRALSIGALAAIAASIVAAIVFQLAFNGAHDDRMEALVMAVAAALMLYMSGWMFLRQNPAAWKAELQKMASRALDAPRAWSIGAIAFLAVFREGAETALFLHALAMTSGGWSLALTLGLVGAAALLAAFYYAMQWLALQLPLRPVFLVTSALLFVMGLRFIGGAMQELQEQALLPASAAPHADWLVAFGLNPTIEALAVQILIAAGALAGALLVSLNRKTPAKAA
ncbi:MAG: FTR1 family protein [Hyphomicrobiales bacterium]|nr:FTR1 family protein [Hyphomicrobiales bacterium]